MGKVLPLYYEGALLTLRVGTIGILLALAVGMVTAVARYWRIPILNTAAVIYTEFSRNTPLLVQLFFLYFGLPKVGIRISGEWCAIIGLAFLGGSYMAEALRAGLESVSTVQTESARVLGLTPFQTMMLVANIIFLIKEISVVSAIALPDLMYVTKDLIGNSYKTDESLILLVSAYVVLLLPISLLGYWLEKKVRYAGFGN